MNNNTENSQRGKRLRLVLILLALALLCGALVLVAAKYIFGKSYEADQLDAPSFYFAVDLAGNGTMQSDETGFSYPDVQSGQWNLYSGAEHTLNLVIRNYFDDLRINAEDIDYNISMYVVAAGETEEEELKTVQTNRPSLTVTPKDSTPTASSISYSGTLTQSAGTLEKSEDAVTVTIPAINVWDYESGTKVILRIKSTEPYVKTVDLTFVLERLSNTFEYMVEDAANNQYAKLILKTDKEIVDSAIAIQPYLTWDSYLSIDNTNSLTYTITDGNYTPQANMETRQNMQISRALNIGESTSILFFKSDVNKSYATSGWQVVQPDAEGKYYIEIN